MKTGIDPEFEASVSRMLHSVRDSGRVEPWPDGLERVTDAARRQQRSRASFGAAGVAACVAASVVGGGWVTGRRDSAGSTVGTSAAASKAASEAASAAATPVLPASAPAASPIPSAYNPSMDPSAGVEPPAVIAKVKSMQASISAGFAAAEDLAPDTSVIPDAELTKLHALALHLASVWGDESPERMEVVYTANSRALDAALNNLGTPAPASYTIELQGSFSCGSCSEGPGLQTAHVLVENYDTQLRKRTSQMPATWLELNRFGRPVTLAPVDTTSTPRPHPSAIAPLPLTGQPLSLAYVREAALQGAVDPTTATVLWSEETTIGDLEARSSHFSPTDLPPSTKVFVVAINGRLTNEQNSWARWAFFASVRVPTGKNQDESTAGYCGEDLCGLSAPAS